jgi:glycosyltransferase involved in cell wall biosynthesis
MPVVRILLVNQHAGSERLGMEYRSFYLAREWARRGHDVTVLSASFSHVRQTNPTFSGGWKVEHDEGVRYVWLRSLRYEGNGIRRGIALLQWFLWTLVAAPLLAVRWKPDLVVTSSTPPVDIFGCWLAAKIHRAALAADVHDLWPETLVELGHFTRRHPLVRALASVERFTYRHADRVVSILPHTQNHMVRHGMAPEKFLYIPNGVISADVVRDHEDGIDELPDIHRETLTRLRARGAFIVGYAGSHGISNSLDTVLDAFGLLRDEDFACVLVGQGPERERLIDRARKMGLDRVHFLPAVPKSTILAFLRQTDVLCLAFQRKELYQHGVGTNKVLDYMAAGKPIVQAVDSSANPVTLAGCGVTVPPEDPGALADALRELRKASPDSLAALGEAGRRFVVEHHDYGRLAELFLQGLTAGSVRASAATWVDAK